VRTVVKTKRLLQKVLAFFRPIILWVLILVTELLLSAVPAALVAAELLPLAHAERGRMAFGGEWLAVVLVFGIAFYAIRTEVCNRTKKEEDTR